MAIVVPHATVLTIPPVAGAVMLLTHP